MASLYLLATGTLLPLLLYLVRHSLPFSWHIRVFYPYFKYWLAVKRTEKASALSLGRPALRLDALPIGKDPFEDKFSMSFQATLDDCDFMGHLSNSCYPKNLDIARSHYAARVFMQFTLDGGWIALGGISLSFKNEIPLFTRYSIRMSIHAWDNKWIYVKSEFVSLKKDGTEITHCIAYTKHCCKIGRKTIPPWFVLAYTGYSSVTAKDRSDHWKQSQAIRIDLQQKNPKNNPLKAFTPARSEGEIVEQAWMAPSGWKSVSAWEQESQRRLSEVTNL